MNQVLNKLKQATPRYEFPVSKQKFSGWKDYDKSVLKSNLCLKDKAEYLRCRLDLVVFNSLNQVYLRSAPRHNAVNGSDMSFFFVGTTIICCCIEALGGFILGGGNDDKPGINDKRFKAFLSKYMSAWNVNGPKGTNVSKWLWKNLRNGLAHGLIIENGGLEDLGTDRFQDNGGGNLWVHAEFLYSDLIDATKKYFSDLLSGNDQTLIISFNSRFKKLFETF